MERREALGGDVLLERAALYVRVWHGRSARDLDEVTEVLAAIDEAIAAWGATRILFDSRDSDEAPKEVADRIWTWLSNHTCVTRVATLVHSRERVRSIDMGSVGRGLRIRAFHSEGKAERWLTMLG